MVIQRAAAAFDDDDVGGGWVTLEADGGLPVQMSDRKSEGQRGGERAQLSLLTTQNEEFQSLCSDKLIADMKVRVVIKCY